MNSKISKYLAPLAIVSALSLSLPALAQAGERDYRGDNHREQRYERHDDNRRGDRDFRHERHHDNRRMHDRRHYGHQHRHVVRERHHDHGRHYGHYNPRPVYYPAPRYEPRYVPSHDHRDHGGSDSYVRIYYEFDL